MLQNTPDTDTQAKGFLKEVEYFTFQFPSNVTSPGLAPQVHPRKGFTDISWDTPFYTELPETELIHGFGTSI